MSNIQARSPAVTEAISALLVQQPFFASLMLDLLNIEETNQTREGTPLDTCSCDGKTLRINPAQFAKWTIHERVGVLVHEIMHVILQHPARGRNYQLLGMGPDLKPYSHKRMNQAADYIINAYLVKQGFKLPLGSLQNSQVTGDDIMDEVYLRLPEDEDDERGDNFDQHETAPDDNGSLDKAVLQSSIQKAKEIAKMQGKGVGGLERLIEDICEPQVSWQEYLRKSVISQTRGKDNYTWSRPNRRKLAVPPHVYWPGRSSSKGPHIAVEIDTSGSIGQDEISTFMGELSGIFTDIEPEMVYVMPVDSELYQGKVIEVDDINQLPEVAKGIGGGGGTDMTVAMREIAERQLPVETLVIFTDGYTDFGDDPGYPVIWCMTTDKVAPWGTTVHVDIARK